MVSENLPKLLPKAILQSYCPKLIPKGVPKVPLQADCIPKATPHKLLKSFPQNYIQKLFSKGVPYSKLLRFKAAPNSC